MQTRLREVHSCLHRAAKKKNTHPGLQFPRRYVSDEDWLALEDTTTRVKLTGMDVAKLVNGLIIAVSDAQLPSWRATAQWRIATVTYFLNSHFTLKRGETQIMHE